MTVIATSEIDRRDRRFGWLLTAPGLTALMLVVTFPLFFTVFVSGFDYTLIHRSFDTFVGIENYRSAFGENYFGEALWVTLKFVVCVVLLEFVIGFTIALMLNSVTRFKDIYYLILLMPLLINPVVVALIWRMFLHPELGIVNYLLGLIGIAKVNWLGDPVIAFWTVVLTDIWHQVSFMIVLLLAGLSALPKEPYEAARMDGANEWRTFIQIVLPLSTPGLATVALFSAIGIWNNFFNALLLVDEAQYYSLQFTIYTTLNNIRFLLENADKMQGLVNLSDLPSQTFRMAMAVVTVGPIILAYPFFQRYFVKGLTIGAVKG